MATLTQERHRQDQLRGQYDHSCVRRWSRHVAPDADLFQLDRLYIPINVGRSHWVGVLVSFPHRTIQFYDSMGQPGDHHLALVHRYLQDEHRLHHQGAPLPADWRLIPCQPYTPRQGNGYDCGVFVCHFADRLLLDLPLATSGTEITRYRGWITNCLLSGGLPAV